MRIPVSERKTRSIIKYVIICFPPPPSSLSPSPVATDPTIVSLLQISATIVRVEWIQPSGGVTGYNIHYSGDGVPYSISGLSSVSTTHEITGLTNGRTYSISVETTSEHLSGESPTEPITLCECFLFSDI